APWRRLRPFRRRDHAIPVFESQIDSIRLLVAVTGMGRAAVTSAAPLIFQEKPDLCISSGFAGGLNGALRVADIITPDHVSSSDGASIACDRGARELALACGAQPIETLYSAPTIIVTAAQKRQLGMMGDAVDMESRTILGEAQQRNIPGLALRVITDP